MFIINLFKVNNEWSRSCKTRSDNANIWTVNIELTSFTVITATAWLGMPNIISFNLIYNLLLQAVNNISEEC